MHTLYIHIDEDLDPQQMAELKDELLHVPHVSHVELKPSVPHDILVEFEERRNIPMTILVRLSRRGLHSDVMSC